MKAPNPTRQALLEHGLDLAARKGLRGLSVREVAASAGANPGSFVYHFGNRERFIEALVEQWYVPRLAELTLTATDRPGTSALQRLRATLEQLIDIIVVNASFINHLLADAMAGEKAARQFLRGLPERHPRLLLDLTAQAQREKSLVQAPPPQLMLFVMAATGMPLLIAAGPLHEADWLPQQARLLTQVMGDATAAQQRLDWALQGISTRRGRP